MVFGEASGDDSKRRIAQNLHYNYLKKAKRGTLLRLDDAYTPFELIADTTHNRDILCLGPPQIFPHLLLLLVQYVQVGKICLLSGCHTSLLILTALHTSTKTKIK